VIDLSNAATLRTGAASRSSAEARGRNTWIVWTFGNDRFWDYMSNHTFGAFDLLKVLSSPPDFGYCTDDAGPDHHINYDSPTNALTHDSCARESFRLMTLVVRLRFWCPSAALFPKIQGRSRSDGPAILILSLFLTAKSFCWTLTSIAAVCFRHSVSELSM